MRNLKSKPLISYASAFASFVLPKINVDEIILFGSVARGEDAKNSDIDLFFNVKDNEKQIKKTIKDEINRFYKSKVYEIFSQKGIENQIKAEIGDLSTWKLKRSIISDGIILYGKYKETPEISKGFTLFNLKPIKNITKRNKTIRTLFGRKEKNYSTQGSLKELNGKKLSPTTFIVPIENTNEILNFLNSERIDYSFFEFWSDQLH